MGLNCARAKSPTTISAAKSAPAIGALKVAAMPAAAPQPTMVRIWLAETLSICPMVEPSAEPIWTIGPSRPTEPPLPIEMAEASALTADHPRADHAPPQRHGGDHLGDAVPLGLAGEEVDERAHDQPARRGNQQPPVPGEALRHRQGVRGLREQALFEEARDPLDPLEERRLHEADQEAEDDGAQGARQAARHRHGHHEEVARRSRAQLGSGRRRDGRCSPCPAILLWAGAC